MELRGREVVLREFTKEDREAGRSWATMGTFEEKFYDYPRLFSHIDDLQDKGGIINLAIVDPLGSLIGEIVLSHINSKTKTAKVETIIAPARYGQLCVSDALEVAAHHYVQAVPGGKLLADIPAFDRKLVTAYEQAGFVYRSAHFDPVDLICAVPTDARHYFSHEGHQEHVKMLELVADQESVEKARAKNQQQEP